MPHNIHVIARYQELVRVELLQLQVHGIPGDGIQEELIIMVVRQGNLREQSTNDGIIIRIHINFLHSKTSTIRAGVAELVLGCSCKEWC